MNRLYKGILLAALGLASASAAKADTFGDLYIGFTTKTGTDVIYDLGGAPTTLDAQASTSITNGQTWDVTSLISGSVSSINWGIIGSAGADGVQYLTPNQYIFSTTGGSAPPPLFGNAAYANVNSWANTMSGLFSAAYPGTGYGVAGNSITTDSTLVNSWNQQTISGATGVNTTFLLQYGNPNVQGLTTSYLFAANDSGVVTQLGTFTLSQDGATDTLTFNLAPVPEPSTYALALLGGVGMLVFSSRNKLRKQA